METNSNNPSQENFDKPNASQPNATSRVFGGLVVVLIGAIILARQLGAAFPSWLFSWEMLLIALGIYIGVRHQFRSPAWIILVLVGAVFLADNFDPEINIRRFAVPIIIIAVGLIIMIKPSKKKQGRERLWGSSSDAEVQSQADHIDSVTVFGGVKKNIISKNFRGGDITTFFGGTELNLTQADVPGPIVLDMTQIFGGTKLVIPPHWKVQSEDLVCIFGGIDDKRAMQANPNIDESKVLVLRGTCLFGGIDLRSF